MASDDLIRFLIMCGKSWSKDGGNDQLSTVGQQNYGHLEFGMDMIITSKNAYGCF